MSETLVVNKSANPVRLSYASIFEAAENKLSKKVEYSAVLLIPKTDKFLVDLYNKAFEAAVQKGIETKPEWKGKRPPELKNPLKDGDLPKKDGTPRGSAYVGHYYITAKTQVAPGVLDKDMSPIKLKDLEKDGEILYRKSVQEALEKVYSGCYVRAGLNFFPYAFNGNNGVSVDLQNIKKISDGERLAGRASAQDTFADEGDFGEDAI